MGQHSRQNGRSTNLNISVRRLTAIVISRAKTASIVKAWAHKGVPCDHMTRQGSWLFSCVNCKAIRLLNH